MPRLTPEKEKKIENITNQLNISVNRLNHLSKEIDSLMKINEVTRVVQKVKKMSEMINQINRLEKDMQVIDDGYSLKSDTSIEKKDNALNIIKKTYKEDGVTKITNVKNLVESLLKAIVGSENPDGEGSENPDGDKAIKNNIEKNIEKVARRVNSNFSYIDEMIGLHKMARFLLFIFMFFFIGKTIDYIFDFFDINLEMGYTYFALYTIIFLLFVILPLRKSVFD